MLQDWTSIHASPPWQSPGNGKSNATRCDLNWFWQLIPVVSVSSKCSVVIHPVRNHHFHHHQFFCAELQDKKHNRGQGWTQTIYYSRYEEETLWNSPNGTETWYTLLVRGINWRRGGYTQTLLYISTPVQPSCNRSSSGPAVQLYEVTGYSGGSSFYGLCKWKAVRHAAVQNSTTPVHAVSYIKQNQWRQSTSQTLLNSITFLIDLYYILSTSINSFDMCFERKIYFTLIH